MVVAVGRPPPHNVSIELPLPRCDVAMDGRGWWGQRVLMNFS